MRDTQKDMVTATEHNNIDTIDILHWVKKMACKMILIFVKVIATYYNKNDCLRYMELVM